MLLEKNVHLSKKKKKKVPDLATAKVLAPHLKKDCRE